jgi:hypothetical protein
MPPLGADTLSVIPSAPALEANAQPDMIAATVSQVLRSFLN